MLVSADAFGLLLQVGPIHHFEFWELEMLKRLLFAAVAVGMASGLIARADTIGTSETFNLTVDACSGGCGSSGTVFGTITLLQSATGVVTVTENLNTALSPAPAFVDTGAGESLVFSLTGNPTITIANLTTGFQRVPTADLNNGPFGTGEYAVTCGGYGTGQNKVAALSCGPGASTTNPGPLSFTVTDAAGVNVSDFAAVDCFTPMGSNTCENIYFDSDIIGPSGRTGDVGALAGTPTPTVPEPSSLALLGTGVLGLAGVVRRRFGR